MFDKIKSHKILKDYVRTSCSENGISVAIDPTISADEYIIIKPDDYYNDQKIKTRPASVDCIIIQKCPNNLYKLTLVELKSIESNADYELENMINKFSNTLNLFIAKTFKHLLLIDYKKVELFFVSEIEIYKRDLGLKMEMLMDTRFEFNGKKYMIMPKKPVPLIRKCY